MYSARKMKRHMMLVKKYMSQGMTVEQASKKAYETITKKKN